ncbi:MAG: TIGR04013 family B12-binding domain/radical SAM domain-containing protein [Candidatus Hermodarchaeota archaeon]
MKNSIAFVVYYLKQNRYSFNALVGALETVQSLNNLEVFFLKSKQELFNNLKIIINKHQKIILGISFFSTQIWEIRELISILRENYGKKIIYIAGGPHPTGDPKGTLKMGFDVVILGEGEETLIELLKKLNKGDLYDDVKGLAYLNDKGKYNYTGKRNLIDLDKYPPFPVRYNKFGAIEITRGCPFLCYFCQTPYILGIHPRHRSIESICNYIRIMKEKNLTDIRFISPNAFSYGSKDGKTLNFEKLEKLLQSIKEIIKPKGRIFLGSFPSEVRPEHVSKETIDLIKKYCSNDNIIIGAQSGSQKILDSCNRGHKVEDVYHAVELTLNSKLKANVDFIFGLPGETHEDIDLTIFMVKKLSKMGARIHTHFFLPLPQTPFAKQKVDRIDNKFKKVIDKLTSSGNAFGEWKSQEKLAIKLSKYLKSGNFD